MTTNDKIIKLFQIKTDKYLEIIHEERELEEDISQQEISAVKTLEMSN